MVFLNGLIFLNKHDFLKEKKYHNLKLQNKKTQTAFFQRFIMKKVLRLKLTANSQIYFLKIFALKVTTGEE